jgi:hypothetical protein
MKKKIPKIAATKHIISVRLAGQGNIKLESPEKLKAELHGTGGAKNLLTYVLHGLPQKPTGFQLVKKSPYFMESEVS